MVFFSIVNCTAESMASFRPVTCRDVAGIAAILVDWMGGSDRVPQRRQGYGGDDWGREKDAGSAGLDSADCRGREGFKLNQYF